MGGDNLKRYEKMTQDEIMEEFDEVWGYSTDDHARCDNLLEWRNKLYEDATPRIASINTVEELEKAGEEFDMVCYGRSCDNCPYWHERSCFISYLSEEI